MLFITFGGVVVAIVSDSHPLSRNEKIGWLLFTGIVAFLEICVLNRADAESKKARAEEHEAFAEERNSFAKLLSNAEDQIANVTGGDSFAYLDYEYFGNPPLLMPKVKVEGRYALKPVEFRVIDTDRQQKMRSFDSAVTVSEWASTVFKKVRLIDHVTPASPQILDESFGVGTNPAMDQSIDAELVGPNGTWVETLRLRQLSGKWEKAIKVLEMDPSKPQSDWKIRKFAWSPGFPMIDGVPDFRGF